MSVITDHVRMHSRCMSRPAKSETQLGKRKNLEKIFGEDIRKTDLAKIKLKGFQGCRHNFKKLSRKAYKKLNLKHLIPLLLIVIYTIIGGAMFLAIEKSPDQEYLLDMQRQVNKLKAEIVNELDQRVNEYRLLRSPRRRVKEIYRETLKKYDSEMAQITQISFSNESAWNFWNAMYFSGTIYTTIGYGNVFCKTTAGQIMTIWYAIFGIPLVLTTLNDLGIFLFKLIRSSLQHGNNVVQKLKAHRAHRRSRTKSGGSSTHMSDVTFKGGADIDVEANRSQNDDSSVDEDDIIISEEEKHRIMNIPVSAALFVTIGWIFLCSALFCLWEDWTYWESVYFFFVSLSTIGLGDVTPNPKAMVLMFGVVLVGLSLVSMCINVIQMRLEELYVQLLMKILMEYQKRMETGQGEAHAALGMMDAWNDSKATKLLKLLPKSKMNSVMQQFNEAAKAQGIEVPAVLQDVDFDKGLPRLLTVPAETRQDEELLRGKIMQAMNLADDKVQTLAPETTPKLEMETFSSQTSVVLSDVKEIQTDNVELTDSTSQFSLIEEITSAVQTEVIDFGETDVQTEDDTASLETVETQTYLVNCLEIDSQTEDIHQVSQQIQVTPDVDEAEVQSENFLARAASMQTDSGIGMLSVDLQTDSTTTSDIETQVKVLSDSDREVQTESSALSNSEQQTESLTYIASEMQTEIASQNDGIVQTEDAASIDSEQQTEMSDTVVSEAQTEASTSVDAELQTDDIEDSEPPQHMQKLREAFKRRKKAKDADSTPISFSKLHAIKEKFKKRVDGPEVEDEALDEEVPEDTEEEESSVESLQWDPIDGMHAEKQRSVGALKNMFETSESLDLPHSSIDRSKSLRRPKGAKDRLSHSRNSLNF